MKLVELLEALGDDIGFDPVERLALAYAPSRVLAIWVGYLALDRRLADAAREGRDPIMVQLRLAWWRDRLAEPATQWPIGEPLLSMLKVWHPERAALSAVVDGWEMRNVGSDGGFALRMARIEAMVALARLGGERHPDVLVAVARAASEWLDGKTEQARGARLPKSMRPLAVLRGNALAPSNAPPLSNFLRLVKIGLVGR